MSRPLVSLTPAALTQMRHLLATQGKDAAGIKLGVKQRGCSGYAYMLDFANKITPMDEVVEAEEVKLVVDPMAVMYVLGTEIDWSEDKLGAAFVFKNPNEKARCGCGESFSV